jgi:hypothetical protein
LGYFFREFNAENFSDLKDNGESSVMPPESWVIDTTGMSLLDSERNA